MKKKLKVWHYCIHGERGSGGWAHVMIREDGFFATVGDYGNYSYWWTSTGCDDIRKFFLRAKDEWHYFAKKLCSITVVNEKESFKAVFEDILRSRRNGDITKAEARDVYEHVKLFTGIDGNWDEFLRDDTTQEFFEEAWDFTVRELTSDVTNFAKRVLPQVAELIEAELRAPKHMSNPVVDVEIIQAKDFYISRDQWQELGSKLPKERLAEVNIFDERWFKYCHEREGKLYPWALWWSGPGSGDPEGLEEILKAFYGSADVVLTWEDGSQQGYRLADHVLTQRNVVTSLV